MLRDQLYWTIPWVLGHLLPRRTASFKSPDRGVDSLITDVMYSLDTLGTVGLVKTRGDKVAAKSVVGDSQSPPDAVQRPYGSRGATLLAPLLLRLLWAFSKEFVT